MVPLRPSRPISGGKTHILVVDTSAKDYLKKILMRRLILTNGISNGKNLISHSVFFWKNKMNVEKRQYYVGNHPKCVLEKFRGGWNIVRDVMAV